MTAKCVIKKEDSKPAYHARSKRRKAASTSASVANSRRLAWANPSSTAGRSAGSIFSGSPSLNDRLNVASAIWSWLSGGSRRTASRAFLQQLGQGFKIGRSALKGKQLLRAITPWWEDDPAD